MLTINPISFSQRNRKSSPNFKGYFDLTGAGVRKNAIEIRQILREAGATFDNNHLQQKLSGFFSDEVREKVLSALIRIGKDKKYVPTFLMARY